MDSFRLTPHTKQLLSVDVSLSLLGLWLPTLDNSSVWAPLLLFLGSLLRCPLQHRHPPRIAWVPCPHVGCSPMWIPPLTTEATSHQVWMCVYPGFGIQLSINKRGSLISDLFLSHLLLCHPTPLSLVLPSLFCLGLLPFSWFPWLGSSPLQSTFHPLLVRSVPFHYP